MRYVTSVLKVGRGEECVGECRRVNDEQGDERE